MKNLSKRQIKRLFLLIYLGFTILTSALSQMVYASKEEVVYCNEKKNIDECDGQLVKIQGNRSYAPHTLHVTAFLNEEGRRQTSLSTSDGDIAILTKDSIPCDKNIKIKGTLDIVKQDCRERTQCIPQEFFVIVDQWQCEE